MPEDWVSHGIDVGLTVVSKATPFHELLHGKNAVWLFPFQRAAIT
jgi:hypothetical protein